MTDFHPAESSLAEVKRALAATPVHDIHTHLYDPAMGSLLLCGIDDQLVYHYLVSESFRRLDIEYDQFWRATKCAQAELIWKALFEDHSPVSEACRGIITTLNRLGLDARKQDLASIRRWYAEQEPEALLDRILQLSKVASICMTNSPFDPDERPYWERGFTRDSRFRAALRIDPLLLDWTRSAKLLQEWGYEVEPGLTRRSAAGARRFLADWTQRLDSAYCMVSLPPSFRYPAESPEAWLIEQVVLPHCREHGQPFALMMGVKRAVNPLLRLAGDGVGRSDLQALENLCASNPGNRFAVTCLARENQHELVVLARKFRNLHPFGCWWFTNTPLLMREMTTLRLELLGTAFTPQHSDARVLDQLVYKWDHTREVLTRCLAERYDSLAAAGWRATPEEIARDCRELLGGAFSRFCKG